MPHAKRYRRTLPISQVFLAGIFGGWGLWQRNRILSYDKLFGTGWNSTAKFHVWPWPFKFAVIENLPAFFAGVFLSWPIGAVKRDLSETAYLAPSLLFVAALWYGIGSWLDSLDLTGNTPWMLLAVFHFLCLTGALIPIGYIGFLPCGILVWFAISAACMVMAKQSLHPHC